MIELDQDEDQSKLETNPAPQFACDDLGPGCECRGDSGGAGRSAPVVGGGT
jgi:hypothetical protein